MIAAQIKKTVLGLCNNWNFLWHAIWLDFRAYSFSFVNLESRIWRKIGKFWWYFHCLTLLSKKGVKTGVKSERCPSKENAVLNVRQLCLLLLFLTAILHLWKWTSQIVYLSQQTHTHIHYTHVPGRCQRIYETLITKFDLSPWANPTKPFFAILSILVFCY